MFEAKNGIFLNLKIENLKNPSTVHNVNVHLLVVYSFTEISLAVLKELPKKGLGQKTVFSNPKIQIKKNKSTVHNFCYCKFGLLVHSIFLFFCLGELTAANIFCLLCSVYNF